MVVLNLEGRPAGHGGVHLPQAEVLRLPCGSYRRRDIREGAPALRRRAQLKDLSTDLSIPAWCEKGCFSWLSIGILYSQNQALRHFATDWPGWKIQYCYN